MKKFVFLVLLGWVFFRAGEVWAQTTSPRPYSIEELFTLIQLRDQNILDTNSLLYLVRYRMAAPLDVNAILAFQENHKTDKDVKGELEAIQDVIRQVADLVAKSPKPQSRPNLSPNYFTNLNELIQANQPVLGTNLFAGGTNISEVARNIAAYGPDSLVLGTNAPAFATNLDVIGKNLARFGTNFMIIRTPSLPYTVFISGGAEFLNPYQIDRSTHALTKTGDSTVEYLEFNFINRFVLRDPADIRASSKQSAETGKKGIMGGNWVCPFTCRPDIQFNLGFTFQNHTTNFSATTMAGSGDYYTEGSVGLPIARSTRPSQSQQVSIEITGGVVADKNFYTIHPNMFFGLGYQTSFKPFAGASSTNACGFFSSRVGAGWTDIPVITSTSGSTNFVQFDNNNFPKYDWSPHCSVQTFLAYPLTESLYLTVEASTYLTHDPPDSWNIKVGASIPLDKVAKTLGSFVNMWK